jgi:pimeloyl-ACP methyl ester carboxylesterase
MRAKLAEAITEATFKEEFLNAVRPDLVDRIPPDLWQLHWSLMTPRRKEVAIDLIAGLKENRAWFPQHRKYLAEHHPPTLIVWGPQDAYMPEKSARAYLRAAPARWRALAAGDEPRRGGGPDAGFPGAGPRQRVTERSNRCLFGKTNSMRC